jgi:hypothetical protein
MAINPETNKFEGLTCADDLSAYDEAKTQLLRPDGTPVPPHWTMLIVGGLVTIEGYTFRVAHFGESYLVLEPVSDTLTTAPSKG